MEKHEVLARRKSVMSLLNTEVILKRKKSTCTHQTDPFLFDLCQVTLKKNLYVESGCKMKAAEPMPRLHMREKSSGTASFDSIEPTAEFFCKLSNSPTGLMVTRH